jgi:protein-S-isoprenylcysteine O-methyltransferase Ste14
MLSEARLYQALLDLWFVLSAATAPLLLLLTAPYGRHARAGWGPRINATLGWVLMEAPAAAVFAVAAVAGLGGRPLGPVEALLLLLWEAHYVHRAFIFPFRRRGGAAPTPLVVFAAGLLFNCGNGYLNGRHLTHFSAGYPASWLADPRFVVGVMLFAAGFYLNRQSDSILFSLRKPGETGYKIPHGGLYRWVSCPNYLGELIEWSGWALATWSLPGLAFALYTAANLVPRARAHHAWYKERFPDYPQNRKAIIPGLF